MASPEIITLNDIHRVIRLCIKTGLTCVERIRKKQDTYSAFKGGG